MNDRYSETQCIFRSGCAAKERCLAEERCCGAEPEVHQAAIERNGGLFPDSSHSDKDLIVAAEFATDAVETDSLECWTIGLSRCKEPDDSKIGKLLKELRACFWHEGTYEERERVWVAAAKLKFALKWRDEHHD